MNPGAIIASISDDLMNRIHLLQSDHKKISRSLWSSHSNKDSERFSLIREIRALWGDKHRREQFSWEEFYSADLHTVVQDIIIDKETYSFSNEESDAEVSQMD